MNTQPEQSQTTSAGTSPAFAGQSLAARSLNQCTANLPSTQRHYAWGPSHEAKSARFFSGHAWGPKKS